jgi:hypothetical protein
MKISSVELEMKVDGVIRRKHTKCKECGKNCDSRCTRAYKREHPNKERNGEKGKDAKTHTVWFDKPSTGEWQEHALYKLTEALISRYPRVLHSSKMSFKPF